MSLCDFRKCTGSSRLVVIALSCCLVLFVSERALAQSVTFGGNAQHTSSYSPPAQNLNAIKWTTPNDLNPGALAHYGSPLVTASNSVLVPVKTATDGFRVDAFNGTSGAAKYTLATDYILPSYTWIPSYNPCIATGAFGTRMYYAGAGGTVWHIDNVDSNTPGTPVRDVFYTLAAYNGNPGGFNSTVFVNTPITADAAGNIYFGFRVQGTAPAPLSTTQSGFARIDSNGNGTYVLAGTAAGDVTVNRVSHNIAPALSNDENTLYVVVKGPTNSGYLLGLNPITLQTRYSVFLRDPRNGSAALISDNGTSSPTVGPDGDVYFGVLVSNNGSRGFLLHFSADLSIIKTPGAFGWDYTPGIVPATSVPSYTGTSSYLLFCKYNDYAFQDGSGVNRVALLDPNATQLDPHTSATGLIEMREVLTVIGPTPDAEAGVPNAVKEWCINAPAVNPATKSVFFNSEDGHLYRWNLVTNSLDQAVVLNAGIGQPYVPSVIGPDGTVYTLNGGNAFALGSAPDVEVTIASSSPDLRNTVVGNSITFTAAVTSSLSPPTGTVTFTDLTYNGFTPVTTTLATNVPLDGTGHAAVTTSSLAAGGGNLGNHFITATYNGNHGVASATFMQKVHANASSTVLITSVNPSGFGQPVSFTANVSSVQPGAGTPTGMVTFQDGSTVIGQVPLNSSGAASITRSDLLPGSHTIVASYVSDTQFSASTGSVVQVVQGGLSTIQFSQSGYSVSEGAGHIDVTVTRSGDTSGAASVDYRTTDSDTFTVGCADTVNNMGGAYGRCDYSTSVDTLSFAIGETMKTFAVPIIDDALHEVNETFSIVLSNATGVILGTPATTTITIIDNDPVTGPNPIFTTPFFVRQHYLDFLSREPEVGEPWTAVLNNCSDVNNNPLCDRLTVSAAFFGSPEFQLKGYFVFRFYRLAFIRLPSYAEIVTDMRLVTGQTPAEVYQKKAAFANAFVQRAEFTAAYPGTMTPADYVSALMGRYGLTQITTPDPAAPDGTNKVTLTTAQLQSQLGGGTLTRAQVLRAIADSDEVLSLEFNRAFVAMQYYGYLRRTPEPAGYNSWLAYLTAHPTDSRTMVNGFMNSAEYRLRFGPQ